MKRLMTLLTIAVLLSATPWVNANPGGNGDANRDFQCGGSCHGDPDLNSSSSAKFEVNIPDRIYAGLSAEITVEVTSLPQTETGIFGAFLLTSLNANGDIPSNEGWKISSNSNLGQTNYAASKAGIVAFSKSLAIEYAKKNININCVSPGFIKTEMTDKISEDFKKNLISKIPSGDLGTGEDVSNCVAFLASDMAKYINGETIHVNGGMYMS